MSNRTRGNYTERLVSLTTTAAAHSTGDVLTALTEVTLAGRFGVSNGIIVGATLYNKLSNGTDIKLLLAKNTMANTTFTIGSPLTVADADLDEVIGTIDLVKHTDFADNCISEPALNQRPIPFELGLTAANEQLTSIYVALIAAAAITPGTTTDLNLALLLKHPG